MTWKIRHEGSPRSMEGLTLGQVMEGLQDGLWEPTDEVLGPDDKQWVAIESHPQLAELFEEVPEVKHQEEETHIDMNPMIDVALVLLVVFILTTSYATLERLLETAKLTNKGPNGPLVIGPKDLAKFNEIKIQVTAEVERRDGKDNLVLKVENTPVTEATLESELTKFARLPNKTDVSIKAGKGVKWSTIVAIQDAAKGAGLERIHMEVEPPAKEPPGP